MYPSWGTSCSSLQFSLPGTRRWHRGGWGFPSTSTRKGGGIRCGACCVCSSRTKLLESRINGRKSVWKNIWSGIWKQSEELEGEHVRFQSTALNVAHLRQTHTPFHKTDCTQSRRWADDHESLCRRSAARPLKTYNQTQHHDPDPRSDRGNRKGR